MAALKWKQKAIGNLKRTILKTEKFILKANGFLKAAKLDQEEDEEDCSAV